MNILFTLALTLLKNIHEVDGDITHYRNGYFLNSMFLLDTNHSEITQIVKDLKNNKSMGYDGLSPAIIKATISDIIIALTIIFNKFLASGQFTDSLKLAEVIPIHKGYDIKQVSNYSPNSVLHFF